MIGSVFATSFKKYDSLHYVRLVLLLLLLLLSAGCIVHCDTTDYQIPGNNIYELHIARV